MARPTRRQACALLLAAGPLRALAQGVPAAAPAGPEQRRIDLQGHRGARGLLPENTLPGFARAMELGVTTLETDIAVTRDGVLVISHDRALNPDITRGPDGQFLSGRGPLVSALSAEELARYDVGRIKPGTAYAAEFADQQPVDGARMPRLSELFALVARSGSPDLRLALETKLSPVAANETLAPEPFARALVDAVRAAGLAQRSSVLSFDWRSLRAVQQLAPEIATVYLSVQQRNADTIQAQRPGGSPWTAGLRFSDHGSVPKMIKAAGGHSWSSHFADLDAGKVREAQQLGLQVLAWTVNDAPTIGRMLDLGVDGIVTDRPDVARDEMRRRGLALPAPLPIR